MRVLTLVLAVIAGCYKVEHNDCKFSCAGSQLCPEGQECVNGTCRVFGASGVCEAPDAPQPDADPLAPDASEDASTGDAPDGPISPPDASGDGPIMPPDGPIVPPDAPFPPDGPPPPPDAPLSPDAPFPPDGPPPPPDGPIMTGDGPIAGAS